MKKNTDDVETALIEAIYISRWSENGESLQAVLTPDETEQIVKNIFIELENIGYEIKKIK